MCKTNTVERDNDVIDQNPRYVSPRSQDVVEHDAKFTTIGILRHSVLNGFASNCVLHFVRQRIKGKKYECSDFRTQITVAVVSAGSFDWNRFQFYDEKYKSPISASHPILAKYHLWKDLQKCNFLSAPDSTMIGNQFDFPTCRIKTLFVYFKRFPALEVWKNNCSFAENETA